MNYLIRDVIWTQKTDPQSGKKISIRVKNGKVSELRDNLLPEPEEFVFEGKNARISPGWMDLMARSGAPGNPQNETLISFSKAAAAGGFSKVMVLPDTRPCIESIESVAFYLSQRPENGIQFLVCAAATRHLEGKKMAEILRLQQAGASAFSQIHSLEDSGFMARLLQYLKHGQNQLIEIPMDPRLSQGGQIHNGLVADNRGLAGIPLVAEEIMVARNISLLDFTKGKMHLACLTSPESVDKVLAGKKIGLDISCSISSNHLAFSHFSLDQFDTVHKVWPPYREEIHRKGLAEKLRSGQIDAVVSLHTPLHYDFKDIEFENAGFGISNLETAFSTVVTFGEISDPELLVSLFYNGPSQILGRREALLEMGMEADFTIFQPEWEWMVSRENWQSKSYNNPFLGTQMKGLVLGVATSIGISLNPHAQFIHH